MTENNLNTYWTRSKTKHLFSKLPVRCGSNILKKDSFNNRKMTSKEDTKECVQVEKCELSDLLALLTTKLNSGGQESSNNLSIDGFNKIISNYDGESVPVKKWFENFELNADAYDLNEKQKYVQARSKIIGTAQLFLESVSVSDYITLKNVLIDEFHTSLNSADIHCKLAERKKHDTETFHEYVLKMKKIASLGDVDEQSVLKYIVNGLKIKNEFKYQMCLTKSFKELREKYELYEQLNKNEKKFKVEEKQLMKKDHCFNCGSVEHKRVDCKNEPKCFSCNKSGHIAKYCDVKQKEKNHDVNVIIKDSRLKTIYLNNIELKCLIDTGSDCTIIKEKIYKKMFSDIALNTRVSVLYGLGNIATKPIGQITGIIRVDEVETVHDLIVIPDNKIEYEAILGYDFIRKFSFSFENDCYSFKNLLKSSTREENPLFCYNINKELAVDVPLKYEAVVKNLIDSYTPSEIEACPVEMQIIADSNMVPFRHSPTRLPIIEQQMVRDQMKEWLDRKFIRKSSSEYASRIVVTKKKDGTKRICVDFRKLNSMVLKDCFPVPLIEEVLEKLQEAKFFTVMDLENGFFHVPIAESSRKFTAFVTKEGLYEFNVAPFGFCNSPANFVRYISYIFQDLINENIMELYIDDIVIFGATEKLCLENVNKVLNIASKYNLKIKWSKCSFLKTKIEFLGHEIENGRIWPGSEKTKAVRKFPTPVDVKGIQSFLGLTNYFRKFVPDYANIARPLTELLKKGKEFRISQKEEESIMKLKEALVKEPVLKIYNENSYTELHTDASKDGFGATLLQKFEEKMHPVYYWSKKTTEHESKLHSYILEVKAAYLAIKKFRHYLLGKKFTLVTDCSAFKQTISKTDVPREVASWIMYLQDFNFNVEHRGGTRLRHVDSLSRNPYNVLTITSEITARLRAAQQKDNHVKVLTELLEKGPFENYKLKNGILYKFVSGIDLLVVPSCMENEVIQSSHEVGHSAVQKTMHAIQQNYYIPHLEKKVSEFIKNCIKCIVHNRKLGKKEGFLSCIDKGETPLHTLHIDHLGPMDATTKKYKHIFAMVDGFTKFVWLFPTKTTSADEVLSKMNVWSDSFGNPHRVISDKGPAFTSLAFENYCKENNIEHILITTGVPRGNGQIERVNRVIISMISKLSSEDTTKWYKFVGKVQKAINSSLHCSTQFTPFEILFGVKMRNTELDSILQFLQEEIIENFEQERQKVRDEAKQQIERAQRIYKQNFDKKRRNDVSYQLNDLVAIKRTQFIAGKKLASEFLGPYKIVSVKGNGRYDIKKVANFEGPNQTSSSSDNMKPWKGGLNNKEVSSGSDGEQEGRV